MHSQPSNSPSGAGTYIYSPHRQISRAATGSACKQFNLQPMFWPCHIHYDILIPLQGMFGLGDSQALKSPEYKSFESSRGPSLQYAATIHTASLRTEAAVSVNSESQLRLRISITSPGPSHRLYDAWFCTEGSAIIQCTLLYYSGHLPRSTRRTC